jgi:hypothetical protein
MTTPFERQRKPPLHSAKLAVALVAFLLAGFAPCVVPAQSPAPSGGIDLIEPQPTGTVLSISPVYFYGDPAMPQGGGFLDLSFYDFDEANTSGSGETLLRRKYPDSRRIAFGDFDGDSYDDILFGTPGFFKRITKFNNVGTFPGRAYIAYGGPFINLLGAFELGNSPNITQIITTEIGDASSGYAVAAGDFDGDGFDDAIINTFNLRNNAITDEPSSGGIYIVYGSTDLRDMSCADVGSQDDDTNYLQGPEGALDIDPCFNCFDEVGHPIPCCADAMGNIITCSETDNIFPVPCFDCRGTNQESLADYSAITTIRGRSVLDRLGQAIAVGDINADGLDDIVVSSQSAADEAFFPDSCVPFLAGKIYVIYGDSTRQSNLRLDVIPGSSLVIECEETPLGETRIHGAESYDVLGASLAVGDINGDGYADIVAGAPRTGDLFSNSRNGEVFVFYGSSSLRNTVIDLASAEEGMFGETRIQDATEDAAIGGTVAVGDVNGDGYDDIIIGTPEAIEPENGEPAGAVHVVFGGPTKPGAPTGNGGSLIELASPESEEANEDGIVQLVGNNLPELPDAEIVNDRVGQAVGVGDLNGDGIDDILIGAPGDNPANIDGRADGGIFYAVLGARGPLGPGALPDEPTRLVAEDDETLSDFAASLKVRYLFPHPEIPLPGPQSSFFGLGPTGNADLNRDGFAEIGVLAPGRNEENPDIPNPRVPGVPDANFLGQPDLAVVIFGGEDSTTASKTRFSRPVDAPPMDFGPVLRAQVDWDGGIGSNETGLGASKDTIVLERGLTFHDILLQDGELHPIGNVAWTLITNRIPSFNSDGGPGTVGISRARVTLEYRETDFSEEHLSNEENFQLALDHPVAHPNNPNWMIVPTQIDTERNRIITDGFIYMPSIYHFTIPDIGGTQFVIVTGEPGSLDPPKLPLECDADLVESVGDVPCGGRRIRGPLPNAQLGAGSGPMAFGDFNNDGFQDILAGAPRYSPSGSFSGPGAAFIVYGVAGAPADLDLSGSPASGGFTLIQGDADGDGTGNSVAAADIDSDGFDDAIIGAPNADPAGRLDAGAVYVIYGRSNLPGATINLAAAATSNGETRIYGDDPGDLAGWAVDAASLNNDRPADLIIGAPNADPLGRSSAGEAYLISGSLIDRATILDLSAGSDTAPAFGETRILGSFGSEFGGGVQTGIAAVACGDLNGDGFIDAAVGAPTSGSSFITLGTAAVVYGSSETLAGAIVDLANPLASGLPLAPTLITGDSFHSFFGQSLSAGDINGDGFDDLVVGAPREDTLTASDAGAAFIIPGSPNLPGQSIVIAGDPARAWKILGAFDNDSLGAAVACGDVDGDGLHDVIVGAPGFDALPLGGASLALIGPGDPEPLIDAGGVFVFYGSRLLGRPLGTLIDLAAEPADALLLGSAAGDGFGFSAKSGADLNGDGFEDFVLGAPFANTLSGGSQSGALLAAYGRGLNLPVPVAMPAPDDDAEPIDFGPTVRASVDFENGEGGQTLITRIPGAEALVTGLPEQRQPIGSVWEFRTTRAEIKPNGNKKEPKGRVEFRYTDAEFGTFKENKLKLHRAESLSGPWHGAGNVQLDPERNTISGKLHKPDDAPVYYVITGKEKNN